MNPQILWFGGQRSGIQLTMLNCANYAMWPVHFYEFTLIMPVCTHLYYYSYAIVKWLPHLNWRNEPPAFPTDWVNWNSRCCMLANTAQMLGSLLVFYVGVMFTWIHSFHNQGLSANACKNMPTPSIFNIMGYLRAINSRGWRPRKQQMNPRKTEYPVD